MNLAVHTIPLWFLVLSLFLPRICIVLAWFQHSMGAYIPAAVNVIPAIIVMIVPRLFILYWIYQDQGLGLWFLIHLIALLMAWGGGGHQVSRRRNRAGFDD